MSRFQLIADGRAQLTTLRQIRAFVVVYRLRKLAAAADQLAVTPSAVSFLLKDLEDRLGVKLFDRSTRTLEPTEAAHEALPFAERVLQDLARFNEIVREAADLSRGRVHVAVTPAISTALLPTAVPKFAGMHPGVRVAIDDCAPDQFVARILSGQVDFGIGTPDGPNGGLEIHPIVDDSIGLICRSDHPLASRRRCRWIDLRGVPVIALAPGYGARHLADAAAASAGVELSIVNEVNYLSSALWMVSSGMGAAIFPVALARLTAGDRIVARQLVDPSVRRSISIVTRHGRSLSPACRRFVEVLVDDLRARRIRGVLPNA
ncbi:hypothetical protein AS156_18755 [Bradyrhizobium macuxiense]|uniref:HTH lysR-type domain-containing protein n=1 Tax=Bradyrhizobium macuxiense TaxID=1755647 RepID=A0A109JGD2_9BRAD|nr:LysR family transcriptional regulator [Bradyrhizobium macuxiense]KWV48582.1 hypothetical protein AS156_18755 [Bradyrhizobium macuxiense]